LRFCTVTAAPARAGWTSPAREAKAGRRAARAVGSVPPVRASDSGAGAGRAAIAVKYAHVSYSPKRARSVPPLTDVRPREPTTSAATTRGDRPRVTTSMPRNFPRTKPWSFRPAAL
jgi:hypothetical protein